VDIKTQLNYVTFSNCAEKVVVVHKYSEESGARILNE